MRDASARSASAARHQRSGWPGAGIDAHLRAQDAPRADGDGLPRADGDRLGVHLEPVELRAKAPARSRRRSPGRGRPRACRRRRSCRGSATPSARRGAARDARSRRRNRPRRRRRGRRVSCVAGSRNESAVVLCRSPAATEGPTIVGTGGAGRERREHAGSDTRRRSDALGACGRRENRDSARSEAGGLPAGHRLRVTEVFGIKPLSGGFAQSVSRPRRGNAARSLPWRGIRFARAPRGAGGAWRRRARARRPRPAISSMRSARRTAVLTTAEAAAVAITMLTGSWLLLVTAGGRRAPASGPTRGSSNSRSRREPTA